MNGGTWENKKHGTTACSGTSTEACVS